ncbi:MAG: tetratricopeptide repeat protein [Planctomycetota bacterium]
MLRARLVEGGVFGICRSCRFSKPNDRWVHGFVFFMSGMFLCLSNVDADDAEISRKVNEARQAQIDGDVKLAAQWYAESINMIIESEEDSLWLERLPTVTFARWITLQKAGERPNASDIEALEKAMDAWNSEQCLRGSLVLLRLALDELKAGRFDLAGSLYRHAQVITPEDLRPKAALGEAWSIYAKGDRPGDSLSALGRFLADFPDHRDAETAALAAFEIWGHHSLRSQAFDQWLLEHAELDSPRFDSSIRGYVISQLLPNADEAATDRMISAISRVDDKELIEVLFESVSSAQRERIVLDWMSGGAADLSTSALAVASKRARSDRSWDVLVQLSRQLEVSQLTSKTHPEVIFAVAESLVQTGRVSASLPWWNALIDLHPTDDLAIHIRRAEAEVSAGPDVSVARTRVSDLRRRLIESDSELTVSAEPMIDSLAAELAIREADLPRARGLLERVIRGVEIPMVMKARAQWLIGETYALNGMYVEAIEAYRLVESIATGKQGELDRQATPWVAASLVQAGAAFEQLGRTRQAQMCYGSLLSRFGDSPHAEQARLRVASLSNSGAGPASNAKPSGTNPTLRR